MKLKSSIRIQRFNFWDLAIWQLITYSVRDSYELNGLCIQPLFITKSHVQGVARFSYLPTCEGVIMASLLGLPHSSVIFTILLIVIGSFFALVRSLRYKRAKSLSRMLETDIPRPLARMTTDEAQIALRDLTELEFPKCMNFSIIFALFKVRPHLLAFGRLELLRLTNCSRHMVFLLCLLSSLKPDNWPTGKPPQSGQ